MFPKLSRFLSASDRVLYKQAHRKDDDTILSKRHSDVMSHPDNVAVQQKVTELRKSSVGSSVSSSSSGAEAKIGFEVISDKKRRSYYFNESIDSAEDALHTIEEDTSLPIVVVHPSDKNMLRRGSSFSDSACRLCLNYFISFYFLISYNYFITSQYFTSCIFFVGLVD